MSDLRVGVIGTGKMGTFHVKRLEDEYPGIIKLLADPNVDSLENCSQFCNGSVEKYDTTYLGGEMLDSVDAVIIAAPSEDHYEIAQICIENEKHVLLEKPIAMKYEEAMDLFNLAQEHGVAFIAGHTQRYNPIFTQKVSSVRDVDIIEGYLCVPQDGKKENVVFDLMIHIIELSLYLSMRYLDGPWDISVIDVLQSDESVTAILDIHGTICNLQAGYNSEPSRSLHVQDLEGGDPINIDLLSFTEETKDPLYHMHKYFVETCEAGYPVGQALFAALAVKTAEEINSALE